MTCSAGLGACGRGKGGGGGRWQDPVQPLPDCCWSGWFAEADEHNGSAGARRARNSARFCTHGNMRHHSNRRCRHHYCCAQEAPTIAEFLDIFDSPVSVDLDSEQVWPMPASFKF